MTTDVDGLNDVGSRLRWAREQSGLSQGQVARLLGFHRPTVSQIEAGARDVKSEEIARFADLYEVRDEWLIRGDVALNDESDVRIEIAARELKKLHEDDLQTVLKLIRVLRSDGE